MKPGLQPLLTADAVRQRCAVVGRLAVEGRTRWFDIDLSRIGDCADLVAHTCRENYPNLDIPCHSRWRHFDVEGVDLWQYYRDRSMRGLAPDASARTAIDLVFVSVLLDAGAGAAWRFAEPVTGKQLSRSEALAAASIHFFFEGLARCDRELGWTIDARALEALTREKLALALQHGEHNALVGLDGRLRLLKGLGRALSADRSGLARPGDLYDVVVVRSDAHVIKAEVILQEVLRRFIDIWPNGLKHRGYNLGDAGYHRQVETGDDTDRIVPFHKLSQWLSYSLIEPLRWGGIEVVDLDGLTGLPEYRNGGLFIDTGVIHPLQPDLLQRTLQLGSEAVVEWRALTVFLLDRIAPEVRSRLDRNGAQLPLASILQGGTWAAGRRIAAERRPGGSPPLKLAIDGTVF